ncbi:NAD(P)-dependent oxidoreductase [Nocardia fusca]|uniref:NAD(P)-dependent oxidoreductase n=1 Tax=Nocardia fusca TaxID=941183 RepID=UPI0037C61856
MSIQTVGFVGVGRLGLPLASALLDAGFNVLCTARGRSAELVERGGVVPGDGSVRAVADESDLVLSCLPSAAALRETIEGSAGLLAAEHVPPLVELSTLAVDLKSEIREKLVARGSDLLDAPVSGTPAMVAARIAVIYASGDPLLHDRAQAVIKAMSPHFVYVGEFGTGTKMKLIAQYLGLVHVTAAAEAMAYAELSGLNLQQVTELISASPGAVSGQFKIRAPLMAAGQYEGRLVTVDLVLKDIGEVLSYGTEVNAPVSLIKVAERHFRRLEVDGYGSADPAKLFDAFVSQARQGVQ